VVECSSSRWSCLWKQRLPLVSTSSVGLSRWNPYSQTCREKDYGTPMICCGACREWYHFSCLGLEQEDTEDIEIYICGSCSLETGLRTASEYLPFLICTRVVVPPLSSREHEHRRKCHVHCSVSLCPMCAYRNRVNPLSFVRFVW